MRLLIKWLSLAPAKRLLVIETAFLLLSVHIGLRLIPFGGMNRIARYLGQYARSNQSITKQSPKPVVWAVKRVGSSILGQNACLTEALAGQILLGRRGIPTRLRIGVKKSDDGILLAHAWLEGESGVLLGGTSTDLQRFIALPDLETAGG